MKEEIKYTIIHQETAETEVYFHYFCEDIRGYLPGKEVKRLKKCWPVNKGDE